MNRNWIWWLGLLLFAAGFVYLRQPSSVALAQSPKPVTVTRLFTGPDGLTHAEEIELKLLRGTPLNQASEMFSVKGAEVHRIPAGNVQDWHVAPRRQLVITLAGRGQVEVAGGKKIAFPPGKIQLAEDLTGKGHKTSALGSEDRITLQIPLDGPVGSLK